MRQDLDTNATHLYCKPTLGRNAQLDARVAARAARKGEIGRAAEYLANDVKLVAARHQRAAKRMEVRHDFLDFFFSSFPHA